MSSPPRILKLKLLLLFFLLFLISPSPAHCGVNITRLPGFKGPLHFHLETGYENVEGSELFYYFAQSERNPAEDPLIFWLTGGPGCTGFNALSLGIGPLHFVTARYNGSLPSLTYNLYAWTKIANIIFLDSPAGTGFSFSTSDETYGLDDMTLSILNYKFLIKWYENHPYFLSNPLYIAGDSQAGKIVPIVTHEIVSGKKFPLFCNLKGYVVGNPLADNLIDYNSRVAYAHRVGIISDELYKAIEETCEGEDYLNPNPRNLLCCNSLSEFSQFFSEINTEHVLELKCPPASTNPEINVGDERSLGLAHSQFILPPEARDINCRNYAHYLFYYWANNQLSREALHVNKATVREWVRCNNSINYGYTINVPSTLKYHLNLIQRGYRALIYSGDQDAVFPYVGTNEWIRSLNFSIVDDWRSWHVDGQIAGYTRKFENDLTFATVKNAGHVAPEYQPKNCFNMFDRWISYKPL